jgi:Tol biopolymer transport system component
MTNRGLMKTSLCLFILFFIITGCNYYPEKIPIADIVFQMDIGKENEVLGFYSIDSHEIQVVDRPGLLTQPYYLNKDTLVAINKRGYPNYPFDLPGWLEFEPLIDYYQTSGCFSKAVFIDFYLPYKGNIVYIDGNIVKEFDVNLCTIGNDIVTLDGLGIDKERFISSFSLNDNSPYLIISYQNGSKVTLMRINLSNHEILDYQRYGENPSLSPDGTQVAYYGLDGIRVMDISGKEDQLLVNDNPRMEFYDTFIDRAEYNHPKPQWAPDGSQILYHKCILESCLSYDDYSIFLYSLNNGEVEKLVDHAINPSWNKIK